MNCLPPLVHRVCSFLLALAFLASASQAAVTFTLRPDSSGTANGDAFVTTGPDGTLAGNNYGGAGALVVSGSGAANTKGPFASLIRFDLAAATAAFDAEYGTEGWVVDSVVLEISSSAANNPIFNANAAGQFSVSWLADDSWTEGTGNPNNPQTDGVTWNDLAALVVSPQPLGTFTFGGVFPQTTQYTLIPSTGFLADLTAGALATLHFTAVDDDMSMVFNARSFGTATSRPALIITATRPVPGIAQDATDITSDSAVLHGLANAGGGNLDLFFEYGENETFGSTVAAVPGSVTGDTDTLISAAISGLQPATTYHFRLKGVDGATTHYSASHTFTTAGLPAIAIEYPEHTTLEHSVSTVDFGQVIKGRSQDLILVIRNTGGGDLTIGTPTVEGTDAGDFLAGQPDSSLVAPGEHTLLTVTFAATGTGARAATLLVPSNDPDIANFVISLQAEAASAGPAVLRLGSTSFSAVEGVEAFARISVIRDGDSDSTATVDLEAIPGTASTADYLFTPPVQTLTFPAFGPNELFVDIPIVNDGIGEANETFTVRLTSPGGEAPEPTLGHPASAIVTIIDSSALDFTGDNKAPAVKIASPANKARLSLTDGATLLIKGTATDNKGIRKVEYSLNDSPFVSAVLAAPGAPQTEWSAEIIPDPGPNTLRVRAVDFATANDDVTVLSSSEAGATVTVAEVPAGLTLHSQLLGRRVASLRGKTLTLDGPANTTITTPTAVPFATDERVSATVTRVFTVRRPLVVTLVGDGRVTPGFAPISFRDPGQKLSLQASGRLPARVIESNPGTIFAGWQVSSATNPELSQAELCALMEIDETALDHPSLSFVFREGLVLTASFSANPFAIRMGSYQGLIHADTAGGTAPSHASEGLFTANLTHRGSFSARIQLEGATLRLSGVFDHLGIARFGRQRAPHATITRRGKPTLQIALQTGDLSGPATDRIITGTISAVQPQTETLLAVSHFQAAQAAYDGRSADTSVPDAYLTVTGSAPAPAGRKDGLFTLLFPARPPHIELTVTLHSATNTASTTPESALPAEGVLLVFADSPTLPSPLVPGTGYFVVNPGGESFQISATHGGPPVDFEADGEGTAVLDPDTRQVAGYAQSQYPQGTGTGTLKASKNGVVRVTASLADGTRMTFASKLSAENQAPLYAPLYARKGFVSLDLQLDHTQTESDLAAVAGTRVLWSRPATNGSVYPAGWPDVIDLDFLGARYASSGPVLSKPGGAPINEADLVNGNALLTFSEGRFTAPLLKTVNVSRTNTVSKAPDPKDPSFTLKINARKGAVTGSFLHEDGSRPSFQSILFQKGSWTGAHGYFLTKQPRSSGFTTESGSVRLTAQP